MPGILSCIFVYALMVLAFTLARKRGFSGEETFRKAFVLLFAGNTLALAFFAVNLIRADVRSIAREGEAESTVTKRLELEIEGIIKKEEVELEITGKALSKAEEKSYLKKCKAALPKAMLGEGQKAEHVTEDLSFPSKLKDNPTQIRWRQDDYSVLDSSGEIIRDALKDKGSPVLITAQLSCGESEDELSIPIVIYPRKLDSPSAYIEEVRRLVSRADAADPDSEAVSLPEKVGGRKVTWKKEGGKEGYLFILLGLAAAVFIYAEQREEKKKKKKARERKMTDDYPKILNLFSLLLGAGLTAGRAWELIVEDYENEEKSREERPAFEAMAAGLRQMRSGMSQEEVYQQFGKICRDGRYEKFGKLLARNLRRGASGLADQLAFEAADALKEHEALVRRRGEEAQTKLLLPMLLLLGVVLVVVIVPAFLSMQV